VRLIVLRRGVRFVHASWRDAANQPLLCVVTRLAKGVVYWRPEGGGKPMYFPVEDAGRYVAKVLT